MAYNSDGYIMIDFSMVDFRKTNQTIDGLFERCKNVIGTNKFILVINANGRRNDVPASDIIDDSSISVDKTWSSNKIDTELDGKADTSALEDYQPKLTAGTNITIDENNVISSTGGAVIDDTVIVNNKVWSSLNTVEMLAPIDTVIGAPATLKSSLNLPFVEFNATFNSNVDGVSEITLLEPTADLEYMYSIRSGANSAYGYELIPFDQLNDKLLKNYKSIYDKYMSIVTKLSDKILFKSL